MPGDSFFQMIITTGPVSVIIRFKLHYGLMMTGIGPVQIIARENQSPDIHSLGNSNYHLIIKRKYSLETRLLLVFHKKKRVFLENS